MVHAATNKFLTMKALINVLIKALINVLDAKRESSK